MATDKRLSRRVLLAICGVAVALSLGVAAPDPDCNSKNCKQCLSTSGCEWCEYTFLREIEGRWTFPPVGQGVGKCLTEATKGECHDLTVGTLNHFYLGSGPPNFMQTHRGSHGASFRDNPKCTDINWPDELFTAKTCDACTAASKQWCKQSYYATNGDVQRQDGFCLDTAYPCDNGFMPSLPGGAWSAASIASDGPCSVEPAAPLASSTAAPTTVATVAPTVAATVAPTVAATVAPTVAATVAPTVAATTVPTVATTAAPRPAPPTTAATGALSTAASTTAASASTTGAASGCLLHTNCEACREAADCTWCGAVVELTKGSTMTSHELAFGKCVETKDAKCSDVKIGTMGGSFNFKTGGDVKLVYKDFKDVEAAKCTKIDTPLEAFVPDTAECETCMAKEDKALQWCDFDVKKGDLTASGGMCMPKDSRQCSPRLTPLPSDTGISLTVQLLKDAKHCSAAFAKFTFLAPASLAALAAAFLVSPA